MRNHCLTAEKDCIPRAARQQRQYIVTILVLFVGVAISATVFLMLRRQDRHHVREDFERSSRNVLFALKRTMATDSLEMRSLRSFYDSSTEVDRQEFSTFAAPFIEAHSSVRVFQWVPRVTAAGRRKHENATRQEIPAYVLTDDPKNASTPSPSREEYFPILFTEPANETPGILGFDLATNAACREAMERSRDTDALAATPSIRLPGETAEEAGPRFFLAVYARGDSPKTLEERRRSLLGFVVGTLHVGNIVQESMAGLAPFSVDPRITDETNPQERQLLAAYRSGSQTLDGESEHGDDFASRIRQVDTLDVAGRQWVVACEPTPEFTAARTTWYPWAAGLCGLTLTGLLTNYLATTAAANAKTLRLASQLTEANRLLKCESDERLQAEQTLRGVLDQTFQFIGRLTPEGLLVSANRAAMNLSGANEESVLNKLFWETPWWSHSAELRERLREAVNKAGRGESVRMEATHPAADGSTHWVDFSLKPVMDDAGKVAFLIAEGHDITDRKAAEQHQALVLRRLEGVNQLQEDLLLPALIEEKLKKITEAAIALLDLDFCRIWMVRPGDLCEHGCVYATTVEDCRRCDYRNKCLHLLASSGRYTHIDGGHRRVPLGAYKIGRIASGLENKFLTNNVTTDPRVHDHEWAKEIGLVSFAGYKLRGNNGEPVGVLALFAKHPISEEDDALLSSLAEMTSRFIIEDSTTEALRASTRRHRLFAENVSDVIWTMDFTGRYTYVSPSVLKLVGYIPEKFGRYTIAKVMTPESFGRARKTLKELITTATRGEPITPGTMELELYRKDGSTVWAEVAFSGMYNESGRLVAVQGIARDLTARRQMEEALREAKRAAEEANAAKSRFLASMSHEIRTPMTAILGYADLLLDPSLTPQNRNAYAATIRRSGEHLLVLINDILDLSRIEAGRMSLDIGRCNVVSLMADVASLARPRAERHGVSFSIEYPTAIPETIRTDGARLRQAIINLVGNAVKFTEHGSVRVAASFLSAWQSNQPAMRFDIIDTGIGIPEDVLPRLFQPFAQGDASVATKFGGTGLGLAISRHIARLLGGELTVASAIGKGSTFTLTIPTDSLEGVHMLQHPAEVEHDAVQHAWPTTIEDLTGVRVLLAEDGYDNRELIRTILHKTGAEVEVAENGRIAVEKAGAESFDLILMDMNMPEMDGYQATQRLRDRGFRLPILALTANAMAGDAERCLAAGCNEFLSKPIDRSQLVRTIATYLGRWKIDTPPVASVGGESPPASNDALVSEFVGDPDMAEILGGFVGRLPAQLDAMREAFTTEQSEELRSMAHKLKGAGGSYGYPSLTEACRRLEEAAKARDATAQSAAIDALAAMVLAIQNGHATPTLAGKDA